MPRAIWTPTIDQDAVERLVRMCRNATPEQQTAGMLWYKLHGAGVVREGTAKGFSAEESCAIFACISPQCSIQRNWHGFRTVIAEHSANGQFFATDKIRAKLRGLLDGSMPLADVVKGPKVTSFYHNLCGDESWVTVDSHAAHAKNGVKTVLPRLEGRTYETYAAHYRVVARILGITNAQAQAMVWTIWRDMQGIHDGAGMYLVA